MVGVPALARCDSGPSVRIGWPAPCCDFSQLMTQGPNRKLRNRAVIIAPPVRKVR